MNVTEFFSIIFKIIYEETCVTKNMFRCTTVSAEPVSGHNEYNEYWTKILITISHSFKQLRCIIIRYKCNNVNNISPIHL